MKKVEFPKARWSNGNLLRNAVADMERASREEMVEALRFYATEWKRLQTALGAAGPEFAPTHELLCDYGERAIRALRDPTLFREKAK